MKKLFSLLTAAALTAGISTTAFAADISVTVDGTPVAWTDAAPFINEDSRTLVPLRPIANALGLTVNWDDAANQATFSDGVTNVIFTIDSKIYQTSSATGEVSVEMDTAAVIANERTYAPARYLAESFGYSVGWDQETATVIITSAAEDDAAGETEAPAVSAEATAPDTTTEAGVSVSIPITVTGADILEDFDFFTYELAYVGFPDALSRGAEYTGFAEYGIIDLEIQPVLHAEPGDYACSVILPAQWFADDTSKYLSADFTLTVAEPSLEAAMAIALAETEHGVFIDEGASAEEVTAVIQEATEWLFYDSDFTLEITADSYDEEAGVWTGAFTITKDGESLSEEVSISTESFDDFWEES